MRGERGGAKRKTAAPVALAFWALVSLLVSCKRAPPKEDTRTNAAGQAAATASSVDATKTSGAKRASVPWIEGNLEFALARAKERGELLFVYWGAKWCPPCHELLAEVFDKPHFQDVLTEFVPLHLDGDTEEAQRIAEVLDISAYPTILVLGPGKEEFLRMSGSLDAEEIERALGSVRGKSKSFEGAITKLAAGDAKVNAEDCAVLAHAAWELLPDESWSRARILRTLQKALHGCPSESMRERAMLASTLLGLASLSRGDEASEAILKEVQARAATSYLNVIFGSEESVWAARSFLLHRTSDVFAWLFSDRDAYDYTYWRTTWINAAKSIQKHPNASVDVRLWCVVPALDIHQHESPRGPVPASLAAEVTRAVKLANEEAKEASERHAVISGAAYLLRRVGDFAGARMMLTAEIEHSDTPFYYWSALSSLEEELGRLDEASACSRKARETATGSASRLQWITNDLLFQAKIGKTEELPAIAKTFYDLAFSLPDGFRGRNRTRAEQVRAALSPARKAPALLKLLSSYRVRCSSLPARDRDVCVRHFAAVP